MTAKKILVIEDNPANQMVFRDLLEAEGYVVHAFGRADEAIAAARKVLPDLILMDIQLEGMDGLTATRLLREDTSTREIPIVALTSYAMPGDRERTLVAGCNGYITKPIRIDAFRRAVAAFLDDEGAPSAGEEKGPAR
jgi:CheY-like chemotaxis protein